MKNLKNNLVPWLSIGEFFGRLHEVLGGMGSNLVLVTESVVSCQLCSMEHLCIIAWVEDHLL